MKKVLLHNLSIKYINPDHNIYNFDQRGVFFASEGDIVVTREKIPAVYFQFLKNIGLNLNKINFIYPDSPLEKTHDSIFKDEQLARKIFSLIKMDNANWALDSFVLTEHEAEWAKKLGISFEGNPTHYYLFGSKSSFRSMAKKYKFLIPKGYEYQKTLVDVAIKSSLLFLKGVPEIIIKQDEGVAGMGSRRFTREHFVNALTMFRSHFLEQLSVQGIKPSYLSSFIVEEWHQNVIVSPSIQLYIDNKGNVVVLSQHIQLFYKNKMTYKGCYSVHWLDNEVQKVVTSEGSAFAEIIAKQGYRGHLSLNAILLKNGKLFWNELNSRRVMSSYPRQIKNILCGKDNKNIHYISKYSEKLAWRGKDIDYVLNKLSPVLFSPDKKSGILPFDFHLLSMQGRLTVMGLGKDKEAVENILNYVESI